jgi:hypothetical protein
MVSVLLLRKLFVCIICSNESLSPAAAVVIDVSPNSSIGDGLPESYRRWYAEVIKFLPAPSPFVCHPHHCCILGTKLQQRMLIHFTPDINAGS